LGASKPSVVILLPGLGASELWSGATRIWPGTLFDCFAYPEDKLKILINEPLEARDILRDVAGLVTVYGSLVKFLNCLHYSEKRNPKNLFVFPYDWRQDLIATTGQLAGLVVQIFQFYQGQCEITLLAHSTGGMISRCLLESGLFDDALGEARKAVTQLITMGTASRGAPQALAGILGLARLLFLKPAQAARLAAAPKYPAAYQHMPSPLTTALWDVSPPLGPRDLYELGVTTKLGLSPGHVAAAANFWSTLSYPVAPSYPSTTGTRYFCFVGSHHDTLTGFLYDGSKNGSAAVTPRSVDDGGDEVVPIWSADPPGLQVEYVGGSHPFLFNDANLQKRLRQLLPSVAAIKGGPPRIVDEAIDASVDGFVIGGDWRAAAGRQLIVKLSVGGNSALKGDVVIERKPPPTIGMNDAEWRAQTSNPIRKIAIDLPAPPPAYLGVSIGEIAKFEPGLYSAYFVRKGRSKEAGMVAYFIVQGKAAEKSRRQGGQPKRSKPQLSKRKRAR